MVKRPATNRKTTHESKQNTLSRDKLPQGHAGLVINNFGKTFNIEDEKGDILRCTARKKLDSLVCGDRVIWQQTTAGDGVIVAILPRQSLLVRPDSHGALKPLAANVSQLLVVVTVRQPLAAETGSLIDSALIDRYLAAAELCHIHTVIIVNKCDLLDQSALVATQQLMRIYLNIGYPVLYTSAKHGQGMEELVTILKGQTGVISGPSGVGKSSLVKALLPDQEIRIGEVSTATGAGRHTTTLATLYPLPQGGSLIDSPGVRDFQLWHASPAEIARGFVEFSDYARYCRFADCLHCSEPGCAVQEAVQTNRISMARYESYRRIVDSTQAQPNNKRN